MRTVYILFIIALLCGLSEGVQRSIFVWDAAGPGASFQHPDSSGTFIIRSADAWVEALRAIADDTTGALFAIRDTIIWTMSSSWPSDLNPFDIIIITLGWSGTGAEYFSPSRQLQIISHLDRTGRTPDTQTALIIEGNDIAYLYADTSSSHYTYAGTFADYMGAVLRFPDMGPVSTLRGEIGSLAENMSLLYNSSAIGPTTSMDDLLINYGAPFASHAAYLFNASSRSPARGLQRRSYSPGSVIMLPFQYGNIGRGANTKEQFLARMLDFCVMPIPEITTTFAGETLFVDSFYNVDFTAYDNRCVIALIVELTTDGGASWRTIDSLDYPEPAGSFDLHIPSGGGAECYLRITAHDSVGCFVADTSDAFVVYDPGSVSDDGRIPEKIAISVRPNPFNSTATISFSGLESTKTPNSLDIYDVSGRLVTTFIIRPRTSELRWNCGDSPTGLYLAKIRGAGVSAKMILLE